MTEEEARELEQANADLKEQVAQKDRCIAELEARLMGAVLRIEELERQQRKEGEIHSCSHHSSSTKDRENTCFSPQ